MSFKLSLKIESRAGAHGEQLDNMPHSRDQIYSESEDGEKKINKQKIHVHTCTTSIPFTTLPKTVCLLSSQGVATVVIKNCEPLVFGPAFAIETVKGLSCRKLQIIQFFNANTQKQM